VFTRGLARFGFRVVEAATGEEALALAVEASPSVVVAELTLPRDDELQAFIRAHRIPYIVTTTNDFGVAPADAVAVLEKPFALSALLAEVFRVLRTNGAPVAA
jgi:DNA-binding response OmpR family regulator